MMVVYQRIADAVHGTIGFTRPEIEIINTKIFQRLRNVKHLGLAYYVYPNADFSRFSHSLGVCYITGSILETLRKNGTIELYDEEIQLYRVAGLLHDIGHYPFSHVFENSLKYYYTQLSSESAINSAKDSISTINQTTYLTHEDIATKIIDTSSEIKNILDKRKIDSKEVINILTNDINCRIINLMSSDLDSDRIDYLLRTAKATSLPYGSIDCDYLISQFKYDKDSKKIVLDKRALKPADHFLLSRYFAYQQLTYHKTVVGLELLFKDIISDLIREKKIDCERSTIIQQIQGKEWNNFDDTSLLNIIRNRFNETNNEEIKIKINSFLERIPPSLVFEEEFIGENTRKSEILYLKKILSDTKAKWATKFKVDEKDWIIWDNEGKKLTEIESYLPVTSFEEKDETEKTKKKQKVLDIMENNKPVPIVSISSSLMSVLSNYNLFCLRLYVVLPDSDREHRKSRQEEIRKVIKEDIAKIKYEQ